MNRALSRPALAQFDRRVAVLGVSHYAIPVRCRVNGPAVECVVPTWSDVGALLEACNDVTLVAAAQKESALLWVFARGHAYTVAGAAFDGFALPDKAAMETGDLYQVLRVEPRRIELVDERRGWGCRETLDL